MTSDEDLLTAYAQGDFSAFDAFYRRHRRLIYAFLLSRLRSPADADEVMQEAFLRLHRSMHGYDRKLGGIAWVITIARNAAIDRLRKRRRNSVTENIDPDTIGSAALQGRSLEARQELRKLVEKLSPSERALVEARVFAEESYEELAIALGGSPEAARQKFSRLIRKLTAGRE